MTKTANPAPGRSSPLFLVLGPPLGFSQGGCLRSPSLRAARIRSARGCGDGGRGAAGRGGGGDGDPREPPARGPLSASAHAHRPLVAPAQPRAGVARDRQGWPEPGAPLGMRS